MMKRLFLLLFLCLLSKILLSQWSDDFSDGDFENNPTWQGNTGKFIIDNGWLRLNDHVAGTSYLSVFSDIATEASWEFVFKMDFNPSSTNYAKVYLVSDQPDLTASLNGYFLRLGSTEDDICLFRQNGSTTEKIISGQAKVLDKNFNQVRVLVTRDQRGYWTLKTDLTGGRNFVLEGEALDNRILTSSYFGVVCIYTVTRSTGFYFDDFRVDGQPYTDMDPPVVAVCSANNRTIQLQFSEAIAPIAPPYNNFFSIGGLISPIEVNQDANKLSLTLSFAEELTCGMQHNLFVAGLSDLSGNVMRDTVLIISLPCKAEPYDVVINEIMADPSPSVHLPEYEYVELYNRSDKNIELEGWTFTYGNTSKTLPQYLLAAKTYVLLVHPLSVSDLSGYGTTLPVLGSQTAITNTGQYLQLADKDGTVISWVDFDDGWYRDPLKANGGWSLEQINPNHTCSLSSNWKASTDKDGGTPGRQNAVFVNNFDDTTPDVIHIAAPDEHTIILYVSKPLANTVPDASCFSIKPENSITQVNVTGKHFDQLRLHLQLPIRESQWYDITISDGILDCAGYHAPNASFHFALPQSVDNTDVVINEILFNPSSAGVTFIELYNRSQNAVRVSDLQLSLRDGNGKLSTPVALTNEPFLLLPGKYLVISRNIAVVMQQFGATNRDAFLQMPGMPSLNKESGRVVLLNKSLHVVDEIYYNSKQHTGLLNVLSGVSLERLHPDRNSFDQGNWHTAAQTVGFGTPGRQNSQYLEPNVSLSELSLSPEVFSPDNDGFDDFLSIHYHFDIPSLVGEVIVFDAAGRKIRQLVHHELLAAEGTVVWDGTDDKGRKALIGVYIIYFQAYNTEGFNKIFKIPCVLAGNRQ